MTTRLVFCWTLTAGLFFASLLCAEEPVYMANGVKIGEVTADSAIVWTRLTRNPERNIDGKPFPSPERGNKDRRSQDYDDLDAMEGCCSRGGR